MDSIFKKVSREVLLALVFFLPEARRIRLERWLRGREETRRLQRAEILVALRRWNEADLELSRLVATAPRLPGLAALR